MHAQGPSGPSGSVWAAPSWPPCHLHSQICRSQSLSLPHGPLGPLSAPVGCACPPSSILRPPIHHAPPISPLSANSYYDYYLPILVNLFFPFRVVPLLNPPLSLPSAHPRLRLWTSAHCPSFSHSFSFLSFTHLFLFTCPHNPPRHDSHANPGGQDPKVSLSLVVCLPAIISTC